MILGRAERLATRCGATRAAATARLLGAVDARAPQGARRGARWPGIMTNRDSRGFAVSAGRGEILGSAEDEQQRKH